MLTLLACSTTPAPKIKIIEKPIREVPPQILTTPCAFPAKREFKVTRDIVESREEWINAFCNCYSQLSRFSEWSGVEKFPLINECGF